MGTPHQESLRAAKPLLEACVPSAMCVACLFSTCVVGVTWGGGVLISFIANARRAAAMAAVEREYRAVR